MIDACEVCGSSLRSLTSPFHERLPVERVSLEHGVELGLDGKMKRDETALLRKSTGRNGMADGEQHTHEETFSYHTPRAILQRWIERHGFGLRFKQHAVCRFVGHVEPSLEYLGSEEWFCQRCYEDLPGIVKERVTEASCTCRTVVAHPAPDAGHSQAGGRVCG